MVAWDTWLLFALACLALAATPGPNLAYLLSRTLAQGRRAGFVSLSGTLTGLGFHVVAAALGLSALIAAVPVAYDAMRWAGAAYLAWLAWQSWHGSGTEAAGVQAIADRRMWRDGVITGILNPKVALFELALFPQFLDPAAGSVLGQSLVLGATQLVIVALFDGLCVVMAWRVRQHVGANARWGAWSRRVLAGVFGALALRLALEERR